MIFSAAPCTCARASNRFVAWAGASHLLLGSDYPYDMGTFECVRQVRAASISEADPSRSWEARSPPCCGRPRAPQ